MALRRLWQLWRDYPRRPLLAAVREATHYGLYDVDRLERMVLRTIAGEYFPRPAESDEPDYHEPDDGDDGEDGEDGEDEDGDEG